MNRLCAFLRDERGSPAAEMALMLPLLMALLFGGMEGGFFFWREHQMVKVAREAARYGARQMSVLNCTEGAVGEPVATKVKDLVDANLAGATVTTSTTICITDSNTGLYAGNNSDGSPRRAPVLVVNVKQAYSGLFATMILPSEMEISATAQSAVMGL